MQLGGGEPCMRRFNNPQTRITLETDKPTTVFFSLVQSAGTERKEMTVSFFQSRSNNEFDYTGGTDWFSGRQYFQRTFEFVKYYLVTRVLDIFRIWLHLPFFEAQKKLKAS